MKYTVLKPFTDKQNGNAVYHFGNTYPVKGYDPEDARVDELVSKGYIRAVNGKKTGKEGK